MRNKENSITQNESLNFDTSIIRSPIRFEDIKQKPLSASPYKNKSIKKALRTLHTLELMAINIYKLQITKKQTDLNRQLIAAMCNEMTHYQDFQIKLYEYGLRPSKIKWIYWLAGWIIGYMSRLMGQKSILKTAICLENKAVNHYDKLLASVDWDQEIRKIIKKNRKDEVIHISRWHKLLETIE